MSYLLGHEAEGSALSVLRDRQLARANRKRVSKGGIGRPEARQSPDSYDEMSRAICRRGSCVVVPMGLTRTCVVFVVRAEIASPCRLHLVVIRW